MNSYTHELNFSKQISDMRTLGLKEGNITRTLGIYISSLNQIYNEIPPRRSGRPYVYHVLEMFDNCLFDGIIDSRILNVILAHDVLEEWKDLEEFTEERYISYLDTIRLTEQEREDVTLLTQNNPQLKLQHLESLLETRKPHPIVVKVYDTHHNLTVDSEQLSKKSLEIKVSQVRKLYEFISAQEDSFFSGIGFNRQREGNNLSLRETLLSRLQYAVCFQKSREIFSIQ